MSKHCIIFMIILAILSFILGFGLSKIGITRSINRIEARSSFYHFLVYQKLQSDFNNGCMNRVRLRLEHIIDEQKMLMAEYVQMTDDKKFLDYIDIRDKKLIDELYSYKIDWGKERTFQKCKKQE